MNIPYDFQESYKSWYKECINGDGDEEKKWDLEVKKNPFIAIESHIHEDATTDLLAHILQTNSAIKKQFIKFLLDKAEDNKTIESKEEITDEDVENTEIETQYSTKNGRLDLFIKIPDMYHIIIESKIFGAKEQPDQMERYIDEIKNVTVLAFYATSDGQGKCQTAGKYNDKVIPLAFYSPNEEQTIYSVLSYFEDDTLAQDFCFYLKYIFRFSTLYSVSFLQKLKIDRRIQKCFNKLFKFEGDYPKISEKINPYTDNSEEYFIQLLKVHALNRYLLKEFNEDKWSYDAVFDGIRVKRKPKIDNIDNTDCNVYFETKYYYNSFYMVITICSSKRIYGKIMEFLEIKKGQPEYYYWDKEQNKLNKKFTYSLWLWIMDPKDIEKYKENSILKQCKNYKKYIEFIFTYCMKEIFDAITENKEINNALKIYKQLP